MSDKTSYLGALNAIVNGERRGFEFLNAWSQLSPDPDISLMLKTVALPRSGRCYDLTNEGYSCQEL